MYLTQLHLDISKRQTLAALTAPCKLHGAVESAFSGPRQRNLWRIDVRAGQYYLLLLSGEKPELSQAAAQFGVPGESWQSRDYGTLLDRVQNGSRWRFRLCANPTYSVPGEHGQRGRVCAHSTPENQIKWLVKQSEKHGFSLKPDEFAVTQSKWYRFKKGGSKNVSFLAVTYDGILTVENEELFKAALCSGIGSGKAYGAGLMTLMRTGDSHG